MFFSFVFVVDDDDVVSSLLNLFYLFSFILILFSFFVSFCFLQICKISLCLVNVTFTFLCVYFLYKLFLWKKIQSTLMMMNCFCGMVDRQKAFSLIPSRDHCQRSSPSQISCTPQSRIWTCAEPEFRLSWMKLCSSDNHYTTAPPSEYLSVFYDYEKGTDQIEDISIAFLRRAWRQSMRKKFRQNYELFMQNKCLYRIPSFYEKRISTADN